MEKFLVIILGAGAVGKSTLTRELCGPDGKEYLVEFDVNGEKEKAKYSLFPSGFSIAGNIKNGSDSVSNMEARSLLVDMLFKRDDVQVVIVDGVRSSKKWDIDWVQNHFQGQIKVIYAYFDLSEEENLRRLNQRRSDNGKEGLSDKTYQNMLAFRARAKGVWEATREYKFYCTKVVIEETDTPSEAAEGIKKLMNIGLSASS